MTVPLATYRLQLQPSFGFDDAAALAPYLAELGVSHVYTSPVLQAAPGSSHGYDVVDHASVNAELGGPGAHARMCAAFGAAGLGQVLDIVPNHMAITTGNAWWDDVLENGPSSRWAGYFDVDWEGPESKLRNTVLIPVLGDHYGRVLERRELVLEREGGAFAVRYFDHRFPVSPATFGLPLSLAAADLAASGRGGDDDLEFLAAAFTALPPATATDPLNARNRHRDKEVLKRMLARLCRERAEVAATLDRAVERINADADLLDSLLERQNYRLAYWRTAGRELDYRRFFDITSLAGLRMEDPQVFADTHALVLSWVGEGVVDGLRIDHPDGLRDPEAYFRRLRQATDTALQGDQPAPAGAGQTWIVIEKILEGHEALPAWWPVDGTTGYDFLNLVGGLFVDPAGEGPLSAAYAAFTGEATDWDAVAHTKKHQVMQDVLAADLNRLTHLFVAVCEASRRYRDFTRHELHEVLVETIAAFRVYRTYVHPGSSVSDTDEAELAAAIGGAMARRHDLDPELFDLLGQVLRGQLEGPAAASLLLRFQQVTGPVMAKAIEDTAFYSFNRLVGLNEVGGDPSRFGVGVEDVHRSLHARQRDWPAAMSCSSTHDTKRSEDVRARLALLSEMPDEFAATARRWAVTNEGYRTDRGPTRWPDRNLEWLLYQTLVGAWPLTAERALAYVEKATREAKVHTSWTDPDPGYDAAVTRFVEGVLADGAFVSALEAFVAPLVEPGRVNSLAATLIKLTAPGVPDLYQGSEVWDLSLVDPDNRRPVDFAGRARLLGALAAGGPAAGAGLATDDGSAKLHLVRTALHLRRRHPETFGPGPAGRYQPLAVSGPAASHATAFVRGGRVATVVPRLVLGLARRGGWADTSLVLPGGRWSNQLTGENLDGGTVELATLLARHPVALLLLDREGS
ncbi:MAG TPA: malto-oligosyltrehalose synthase [Acidimicrobiales bacterium]|nr:malto-oligosyltrehalose synthase [Acidimicrobiales bacterium]